MRIEGHDDYLPPDEYVHMVAAAVEARIRVLLADLPASAVLRDPEDVADAVVGFVEVEQVRLAR